MQTTLFLYHKKREPKRIDQSRYINKKTSDFHILFSWVWACYLPGLSYIFSCLYIIFLSGASSSSHVIFNIARQRGPKGPERSPGPRQTSPTDEIHHDDMQAVTLYSPNLSHMDFMDCSSLVGTCRLHYSCTTQSASQNELINPEISMKTIRILHIIFLGLGLPSSRGELYPLMPVWYSSLKQILRAI